MRRVDDLVEEPAVEGVAFSLRDTFTLFSELNIPVTRIRLGGGGARSPLWQQILGGVTFRLTGSTLPGGTRGS